MITREAWLKDIPCQFREGENINGLIGVFSKELDELLQVNQDLMYKVDLATAEGKNLDRVGEIVNLSRPDAYKLLELTTAEVVGDEMYRNALRFKVLKNNTDGTYDDIMKGLHLLWDEDGARLTYGENNFGQAEIEIGVYDVPTDAVDPYTIKPMVIKPGGVRIWFDVNYKDKIQTDDWERFCHLRITSGYYHHWDGRYRFNNEINFGMVGEQYNHFNGEYNYDGTIYWRGWIGEEEFDLDAVLLNQAKRKMLQLRHSGESGWKIAGFAFGTGTAASGGTYTPVPTQTALVNQIAVKDIASSVKISDNQYEYTGILNGTECDNEPITEIGLVDSDGDLVCIKTFDPKIKQPGQDMVFKIDDMIVE